MQFSVRFYATVDDDKPLAVFLRSLRSAQPILHAQVVRAIKRIEHSEYHGPPLTELVDPERSIYELRVGRADIARVFFFFRPDREIILTNGYVKKRQQLDLGELERARRYKADWEARHG
jgi:hypothetical protein